MYALSTIKWYSLYIVTSGKFVCAYILPHEPGREGTIRSRPQLGVEVLHSWWLLFMRFRWAPIPGDALTVRETVGVRSPLLLLALSLRDSGERCSLSSREGGYGMLFRRDRDRELLELSREARLMEASRE